MEWIIVGYADKYLVTCYNKFFVMDFNYNKVLATTALFMVILAFASTG